MARLVPSPSPVCLASIRDRHVGEGRGRVFDTLRVDQNLSAAGAAFDWLRSRAPVSPYQQPSWLEAWLDTEGRRLGVTPMIVTAKDATGRPVALLPLCIATRRGLRCAEFLGGRYTNYNLGLFDPAVTWRPDEVGRLLATAAETVGGLDLFRLVHQPTTWEGIANPLAELPRTQDSPSCSHVATLTADAEQFMRQHLSGPARKKLRAKAAHLAALGTVSHECPRDAEAVRNAIEAHLAQKSAKLASLGIRSREPEAVRALLERACLTGGGAERPVVELHALRCGDRIVATFGGLQDGERFSGLFISHDQDAAYARCSPGELLLNAVLRDKCAAGLATFDLGVGEARYKDSYCPLSDPLVDCVLPVSVRGHAAALVALGALRAKTMIKRNPRAWGAAQALRKSLRGVMARA